MYSWLLFVWVFLSSFSKFVFSAVSFWTQDFSWQWCMSCEAATVFFICCIFFQNSIALKVLEISIDEGDTAIILLVVNELPTSLFVEIICLLYVQTFEADINLSSLYQHTQSWCKSKGSRLEIAVACDSKGKVWGVSMLVVHNEFKNEPLQTIIPISTICNHSLYL